MMKHISKTEQMRKQKLKVKGFRWENKMGLKAFPTGMPWEKTGPPWEKTGPWAQTCERPQTALKLRRKSSLAVFSRI